MPSIRKTGRVGRYTIIAALALGGCVNPTFRAAVQKFGTETEGAMKVQADRLKAVEAARDEEIKKDLAARRVELTFSPNCGTPEADGQYKPCVLGSRAFGTAGGVNKPIERPYAYIHLRELEQALSDYGANLSKLAADASEDDKAFAKSATSLATSVGKLDDAIAKLSSGPRLTADAQLGTIATVVSKIASIGLAQQRQRALKEIISKTNPYIQEAVKLLVEADTNLQDISVTDAYDTLSKLDGDQLIKIGPQSGAKPAEVRAYHDLIYAAVDCLNAQAARNSAFVRLGAIHALLARAVSGSTQVETSDALKQLALWNAEDPQQPYDPSVCKKKDVSK